VSAADVVARGSDDRRLVGRSAARLERCDRRRKVAMREVDQREEVGRRRALLLEPAVHHLLDAPRALADARQADHASAALQGVEAPADGAQDVDGTRLRARHGELGVNRLQDLRRLLEEDGEELGVDDLRVGDSELRRLLGRGRWRERDAGDLAEQLGE
jgi:hypothetical protein